MGENRLFWPQEMMDQWVIDEKASIRDDILEITAEKTRYHISQAVHFIEDVGDGKDAHQLLGKVKEVDKLIKLGAEHYLDSVLLEDSAYQVAQGFTGIPVSSTHDEKNPSDTNRDAKERELLANFLLDNL